MSTESKREKRELILTKAREAFERFGLRKTTMDDIAQGCGLRKAALYYYFDSKEAIIAAMLRRIGERLSASMRRRVEEAKSAPEALSAYFCKDVEADAQEGLFMLRLAREDVFAILPLAEEAMEHMERSHEDLLREILDRGIAEGSFLVDQPEEVSAALFSVFRDAQKSFLIDPAAGDEGYLEQKMARMRVVVELVRKGLMQP